jgi:GAF domain-containing protein
MSNDKKQEVLSRIGEIENFITTHDGKAIVISALGKAESARAAQLRQSSDSLTPILRTALVINARESAMRHQYERFMKRFPEITTLSSLQRVMESTEPLEFCRTYLDINARLLTNPKYCLLKVLTDGFLKYQKENGWPTEIEAIRQWSARVDLDELKKDPIGRLYGVGPGVVGNIKLCLGEPVVKRDRRVVGVMTQYFQADVPRDFKKFVTFMAEFAQRVGIQDLRYLDSILFEYGKAKNISPKTRRAARFSA